MFGGGVDRDGWDCSKEFEVIHISLFDREVGQSPPLFIQTAKQRAGTGEHLIPGPYALHLPASFSPVYYSAHLKAEGIVRLKKGYPSISFSYLHILFKVVLGWNLSQNALGKRQGNTGLVVSSTGRQTQLQPYSHL